MDLEKLYDLEPGQFKNKLDGYNDDKHETQLYQAVNAFKIAYHIRSEKSFSFDDFTDIYPWFEKIKQNNIESQKAWRDRQRKLDGASN